MHRICLLLAGHEPLHEIVKDAKGNLGEYMGETLGKCHLRPIGGGTEWDVNPPEIRECPPQERMQAKLTVVNTRSRDGR